MLLSDLEEIVKLQEKGTEVRILTFDSGSYVVAGTLCVSLNVNVGGNYKVVSPLKQLFLRKRKNKAVEWNDGFVYDGQSLETEFVKLHTSIYCVNVMFFDMPKIPNLPMGDKEDITGWNDTYFICVKDNYLYVGYTNLNKLSYHREHFESELDQYLTIPFSEYLSVMNGTIEMASYTIDGIDEFGDYLLFAVDGQKVAHLTRVEPMSKRMIAQWQYLLRKAI